MKLLLNVLMRLAAVVVPCWIIAGGHAFAFLELTAASLVAFGAYAFCRVAML